MSWGIFLDFQIYTITEKAKRAEENRKRREALTLRNDEKVRKATTERFEFNKKLHPHQLITWHEHITTYTCERHGVIPRDQSMKTICTKCFDSPPAERKRPKSKLERVRRKETIGYFHKHYQKYINDKYRQHKWSCEVCGYDKCIKQREPDTILEEQPLSVTTVRDRKIINDL